MYPYRGFVISQCNKYVRLLWNSQVIDTEQLTNSASEDSWSILERAQAVSKFVHYVDIFLDMTGKVFGQAKNISDITEFGYDLDPDGFIQYNEACDVVVIESPAKHAREERFYLNCGAHTVVFRKEINTKLNTVVGYIID